MNDVTDLSPLSLPEACARVEQLTGLQRGPTQVRRFLKDLGLKWQRVRGAAIEATIANLPTTHANDLATLMTLHFQRFENVSLMAA